jgi:hypothetical protein
MSFCLYDLDVFQAGVGHSLSHPIRRRQRVGVVRRLCANAGNAQEIDEFVQKCIAIIVGVF